MSNLILKILKVLKDEIDKKEYKNKHKFSQKGAKDGSLENAGYPNGLPNSVPNWSLQKSKSIKIIGTFVKVINN